MIDWVDVAPDVAVSEAEYTRLLGFPRDHVVEGRALELVEWARDWYARNGRPWVYARQAEEFELDADGTFRIDGTAFRSDRLRGTLERAGADRVVLVAVSAGPELEHAAHQAWIEERPDEYFFLEMLGSAVVEHLTTMTGAKLCGWADSEGAAVLPHYSPGYPEWDIADQPRLMAAFGPDAFPGTLDVLDSGMLRPKKSLLAVFGVTPNVDRVTRLTDLVPCESCSYAACQFRRVPYARASAVVAARPGERSVATPQPAVYSISTKALKRWAAERLSITTTSDGEVDARFRYDGTTCSNMGHPLAFDYRVRLGPREDGHVIREQHCSPAAGDIGYQSMCEYIRQGDALVETIAREHSLVGRPLDDVLTWKRPMMGPACYCERDARDYKWGLVFETIHYALSRNDGMTD